MFSFCLSEVQVESHQNKNSYAFFSFKLHMQEDQFEESDIWFADTEYKYIQISHEKVTSTSAKNHIILTKMLCVNPKTLGTTNGYHSN